MKIQILLLMLTAAALSAESKDDAEIRSAIKALQTGHQCSHWLIIHEHESEPNQK